MVAPAPAALSKFDGCSHLLSNISLLKGHNGQNKLNDDLVYEQCLFNIRG